MEENKIARNYEAQSHFGFDFAIQALKDGLKVTRTGWDGKGMYIEMQRPDEHSKMGLPYLYISTVEGKLVPWLASQTDLLSEDWQLT